MKILSPTVHGYLDYMAVLALLVAPALFDFSALAANTSYTLAVLYFVFSLCTAYPLGAFKLIPFTVHGGIELATAVLFIVLPWIVGFAPDDAARNFFIIAGVLLFAVWLVTDYKAADTVRYGRTPGRGVPTT